MKIKKKNKKNTLETKHVTIKLQSRAIFMVIFPSKFSLFILHYNSAHLILIFRFVSPIVYVVHAYMCTIEPSFYTQYSIVWILSLSNNEKKALFCPTNEIKRKKEKKSKYLLIDWICTHNHCKQRMNHSHPNSNCL